MSNPVKINRKLLLISTGPARIRTLVLRVLLLIVQPLIQPLKCDLSRPLPICVPNFPWYRHTTTTTAQTVRTVVLKLSGFVCAFRPAAPCSSPKHTIYAFIINLLNCVVWKRLKKQKRGRDWPISFKKNKQCERRLPVSLVIVSRSPLTSCFEWKNKLVLIYCFQLLIRTYMPLPLLLHH